MLTKHTIDQNRDIILGQILNFQISHVTISFSKTAGSAMIPFFES